jgi:hypothetical protein
MSEKERPAESTLYNQFMAGNDNPNDTIELAASVLERMGVKLVKVRKVIANAKIERDQTKAQRQQAEADAREEARSLEQERALALLNAQAEVARANAAMIPPPGAIPAHPEGNRLKLPKMPVRKFAGARSEWMAFKRYLKTIEEREKSGVVRLIILKSLLEGEPKRLIDNLDDIEENYAKAIQLLDREYGDEKMRVRELLVQFKTLKECKNFPDVKEFRLQLELICMQLESSIK